MPVTKEQLKKAFGSIADVAKNKRFTLDPGKVATALVGEMSGLVDDDIDDPDAEVERVKKRVEDFGALLETATEDDDGNIVVSAAEDNEIAKDLRVDEKKDDEKKRGGKKPKMKDETAKGDGDDEDDDTGEEVDTEKGYSDGDEEGWPSDMAPRKPPTYRRDRVTKGEIPVQGRRGARENVAKMREARERALERRDGGGERCMS